jgi:cysteinyl-tRNA synthetase
VALQLYDTGTRSVRDFVPRKPGVVTIYLCGATVQSPPHIGHIRSGVSFDVLRRWLARSGYDVVFCRNVTDVEDKVIAKAADRGIPAWQLAYENERAFSQAYEALGCLPPTIEPRATGHIPEIHRLIHRLIDSGHAYAAGGDVYFDVSSWPAYGALSGQKPEAMQPAADTETDDRKRDPHDFALWKAAKPGEPTWDSPWGPGRPGWHIECSAMSERYLGAEFDIHGGGIDLEFPHHENEIAQSQAAGNGFAAYWMHNAWVTDAAGEKMSKSLDNSMLVSEAVHRVRPVELRYYLVAPHYRSMIRASDEGMEEAATAYRRLESFVDRATELVGAVDPAEGVLCADFVTAMDDDLSVPRALAAVHEVVREGNKALEQQDKDAVRGSLVAVRAMLAVLGLDPHDAQWRDGSGSGDLTSVIDGLVSLALQQRQAARERKDYAAADAVRDQLGNAGIAVEDTPSGPRWTLRQA